MVLIANGDWYQGEKLAINESYSSVYGGKRTGATITSKLAYGPGSFEVEMKLPSFNGICTSMWLYNYISNENATDDNYEIDIELHGTASGVNYSYATCTSWLTLTDYQSEKIALEKWLNDGQFHVFRIDWHTGSDAKIEYYVDGILIATQTTYVPTNKMYLNIGCWFPKDWCGDPCFETDMAIVRSFKYTQFEGESATENNCAEKSGADFKNDVAVPEENLIANANFVYALNDYGWSCSQIISQTDGLTFKGSLVQDVTFDCAQKTYSLTINSSGDGVVTIKYLSIVDGVEVKGEVSTSLNSDGKTMLTFTPTENCTRLRIEITAQDSVHITYANLKLQ